MLETQLAGIFNNKENFKSVIAYVDDVTILATQPQDIEVIKKATRLYERASGATLNLHKSRAMAITKWTQPATALRIEYQPEIKVLGVTFRPTIKGSIDTSWKRTVQVTRATAQKSYHRSLCLAQRIQHVRIYLFAKIWYLAQVLPPTSSHVKQLNVIAFWFIWQS
jgi:hypothetical protein